jgi:hypothetical protein
METLEWAKDKILMGAERKSAVISPETARLTAYHEGEPRCEACRSWRLCGGWRDACAVRFERCVIKNTRPCICMYNLVYTSKYREYSVFM